MFLDALLPNLLLFAAGQAAAWGWLRTGCVRRGVLLMVVIWTLADAALLARFVFADETAYALALLLLQLACIGEAAWLLLARLRRRFGRLHRQRPALFGAALLHYLRRELPPAEALLRRLRRHDPWDVPSAILLAAVLARQGRQPRSRRLLLRARALDTAGAYRDLVQEQLQRSGLNASA